MKTQYYVPQYLKDLKNWILWKKELDSKDRQTKVLYSANYNGRAKTNDSKTWSSYERAKQVFEASKNYDGIGIVISLDTRLIFIDVDHCFNCDELTEQAKNIVNMFSNSFIEVSQSGEGIHILTQGTIERSFKNSETGVEMYSEKRFIAFTGNAINPKEPSIEQKSIDTVFNRYKTEKKQSELQNAVKHETTLSEREIIEKAMVGDKQGGKFTALYGGNWQEYFSSQSEADQSLCNILAFWCNRDAGLIDSIFRSSGLMRDKWNRAEYKQNTITNAINGCSQDLAEYIQEKEADKERNKRKMQEQEVKTIKQNMNFNSSLLSVIAELKPEEHYKMDDKGNGELFADIYKGKARFNITAKEWYIYDGKKWLEDTGSMIVSRYAKELADALLIYSTQIKDDDKSQKYRSYVAKLGQLRYRKTMLEDAKDKNFISSDDLDKDLYMLNCTNCVIDLKTFEVLEHNPDLLLSKISNVTYDESAECKEFLKFMDEIMQGNQEKIEYLQKLFGYSLTGDTREETCYILYGNSTRNGKSTLVETIAYMLGGTSGYCLNLKPESLAQKQNNDSRQASGDIARLKGARFLNASEPPKRMIFDVGLLKTLLGRDSITARHLYEREFQFIPCFKLFINTNFLPLITDDTLFSSGRINIITFDKHFEPHEQDKTLKDRLRTQDSLSGILNWCIAGLKKYYEVGAKPPQPVLEATEEYRNNSDKIGNFIAERLEASKTNCQAKDVYEVYQVWCTDNGYGQENKGNFFAELRCKGILANTGTVCGRTVKNVIVGYDIASDWQILKDENIPYK